MQIIFVRVVLTGVVDLDLVSSGFGRPGIIVGAAQYRAKDKLIC